MVLVTQKTHSTTGDIPVGKTAIVSVPNLHVARILTIKIIHENYGVAARLDSDQAHHEQHVEEFVKSYRYHSTNSVAF